MPLLSTHQRFVSTPAGDIYTKSWTPAKSSYASTSAPVVLFHDSLGSVELWRDFPEKLALSLGRQVIAYDRPGFGRSYTRTDKLESDFIINEASGPFAAIRAELGITDFIALGHSVGGAMAAVCAVSFPDHCVALITEAAQAFVEDRTVDSVRAAEQVFLQDGQINRLRKYHGHKAEWVLGAWTGIWLSKDFQHWTLKDTLKKVRCPVLAIHGEDDEFGSGAQPQSYTSLPAGPCVMELLPDCGHVPHRDKLDVVTAVIADFCAQYVS
ncbi:alpha/beta fold hydrolase [Marinobacter salexigens]|uniref:alpha/beta fold hydrolase n=1 Tax=Marinobacter salexigens TaxID=1925763 RepID=UPI000C28E7D2|nr:alpha/beta hydrolase [Marinobacter salexigens]